MSEAIEIGRSLEAALRGGFSLRQALVLASVDHPGLVGVARAAGFGPLEAALEVWQATLPDSDTALYVAAARLQLEDHGKPSRQVRDAVTHPGTALIRQTLERGRCSCGARCMSRR